MVFFDLYYTHGQAITSRFESLSKRYGYFDDVETGWSEVDPLFSIAPAQYFESNKPIILYASTFSPKLTSATDLFNEIKTLSQSGKYNWLLKFHPKMDDTWVKKYKPLNIFRSFVNCELMEIKIILSHCNYINFTPSGDLDEK